MASTTTPSSPLPPITVPRTSPCPIAATRPTSKILHHDIGALRHVLDELEPALGFRVDGDGFLVGVEQQEIPGVLILVLALARAGLFLVRARPVIPVYGYSRGTSWPRSATPF